MQDSVTMRIYFTTKRLTSLMQKNNHISIDPTYKLIWQGYPVFMVGTTDMDKQYHPFGLAVCINEEQADFEFVFEAVVNIIKNIIKKFSKKFLVRVPPYVFLKFGTS